MNEDGILCVDDIIKKENYKDVYTSDESYRTLKTLEHEELINKNYFIVKRLTKNNKFLKKYISLSFKNKFNV